MQWMQIEFAKSTKISVNLRQVWAKRRLNSGYTGRASTGRWGGSEATRIR